MGAEYCPNCRRQRVGFLRYCRGCGFDFDAPEPVAPAASPDSVTPAWEAATPRRRFGRYLVIGTAVVLGLSALSTITAPAAEVTPAAPPSVAPSEAAVEPTTPAVLTTQPTASSPPSAAPQPAFAPTGPTEIGTVVRVVDGDTIHVVIDGIDRPLRYIGMDTPEPNATDPVIRQLADAATVANAKLVDGREVILERDVSETDRFDRLLRNVWIDDGGGSLILVNLELVRQGFAQVSTFPPDVKYVDLLLAAQEAARDESLGLWAAAPPQPLLTLPTIKPFVGGGDSKCHPSYTPCLPIVDDLDCADVRRLGKAPVRVKGPDDYRLDREGDGLGCE